MCLFILILILFLYVHSQWGKGLMMENGQGTGAKLGLPPLTPEQQEALQKVIIVLYCFTFYFLSLLETRGGGGGQYRSWAKLQPASPAPMCQELAYYCCAAAPSNNRFIIKSQGHRMLLHKLDWSFFHFKGWYKFFVGFLFTKLDHC